MKASIDARRPSRSPRKPSAPVNYQVGTMIELPRAALKADEIAETAEFFSFGTNDLTQTTFGISRDDAASFLGIYTAKGILPVDPFVSIDRDGVGELMRIAVERGRKVRQEPQARHLRRARRRSGLGRRSATRSGSTTCRARRSACRSRGSPPRRRRSARTRAAEHARYGLFCCAPRAPDAPINAIARLIRQKPYLSHLRHGDLTAAP